MIRKLGLIVVLLVVVALLASGCTQQLAGNNTTDRTPLTTRTPATTTTLIGVGGVTTTAVGAGGVAVTTTTTAAGGSDAGGAGGAAATVTTSATGGSTGGTGVAATGTTVSSISGGMEPVPTPTTFVGLGPTTTVTTIGTLGAGQGTIMEILEADGRFTQFVQALQLANLDDRLADDSQTYTVFAPTDAAFDKLPSGAIESLSANPTGQLTQILLYHIAMPGLRADGLENIGSLTTLQEGRVTITTGTTTVAGETTTNVTETMTTAAAETGNVTAGTTTMPAGRTLRIDDAQVIEADILATNGVIHAIDTVLTPTINRTLATSTVTPETTIEPVLETGTPAA